MALPAEPYPWTAPDEPFPLDLLDAELAAADDPTDEPSPVRGWQITGPGTAEWAMAQLADTRSQQLDVAERAAEWAQRIQAWWDNAAGPLERRAAFFTGHLERWAVAEREATGKATVTLPSGVVRTRATAAAVEVLDDAAVVEWADSTLTALALSEVVPPPAPAARRAHVVPLRRYATITEVVDHAVLTLADGEVLEWVRLGATGDYAGTAPYVSSSRCPGITDLWPPVADEGEAQRLVARVEVLHSHDEVRGPNGLPVPGVTIRPAAVTATVTAEVP